MKKNIRVTEPSLPPLEEFIPYLEEIWENKWLTNNGAFHQEFETALSEFLGVKYVSLLTSGMSALQIGLNALRVRGEVITTPFTFVATTHAIHLNGCTPVFCDIDPETFNIDVEKLESLITPRTTAILPVHTYGIPCNTERLEAIAKTYGLKLFYDAAHAFGVTQDGTSILNSGDLSMLSFHATKIFNTAEGGALITNDEALKTRIDFLKNFGFANEVTVVSPGANGKLDELRSALGILQLKHFNDVIETSKTICEAYRTRLDGVPGLSYRQDLPGVKHNYSYFPVLIDESKFYCNRDALYEKLKRNGIYARRYFYPLCSQFSSYRALPSAAAERLPVAETISRQVLCLPIHPGLTEAEQDFIVDTVTTPG